MSHSESLGSMDACLLAMEDPNVHMEIGGILLFGGSPRPAGVAQFRELVTARLARAPRLRQRVDRFGARRSPAWVDDERFQISDHVRQFQLPAPASLESVKQFASDILSRPLDHARPLWEAWWLEGLPEDRVAVVLKAHHCMVDGSSGLSMLSVFLDPDPNASIQPTEVWRPRPAPRPNDRLDAVLRGLRMGAGLINGAANLFESTDAKLQVADTLKAIGKATDPIFHRADWTNLNVEVGPNRHLDWIVTSFSELDGLKRKLGVKINDVVLSVLAGALRSYVGDAESFQPRNYRAMIPVSSRDSADSNPGNHLSEIIVQFPRENLDPLNRLLKIAENTRTAKSNGMSLVGRLVDGLGAYVDPRLLAVCANAAARARPYNLIVTNIAGPAGPQYCLGRRLDTYVPIGPVYHNLAMWVGVLSFEDSFAWAINCDRNSVQNPRAFLDAIPAELAALQQAVERQTSRLDSLQMMPSGFDEGAGVNVQSGVA